MAIEAMPALPRALTRCQQFLLSLNTSIMAIVLSFLISYAWSIYKRIEVSAMHAENMYKTCRSVCKKLVSWYFVKHRLLTASSERLA